MVGRMADDLLVLREISKTYRRPDGEAVRAVDAVSLTVCRGETVAVVGESGSGKTTLARIALCLVAPDAGEVLWDGRSVSRMADRKLRPLRHIVQPIFQDPASAFNPRHSVREVLRQATRHALDARAAKENTADTGLVNLLEDVGLTPGAMFLGRYPGQLSGGQRQRLAIARAMAVRPDLIIADEALSGADLSIRGQLLNLLLDLQQVRGLSYLLITHDISLAREFAHRVAVMYQGRICEEGPAEEVLGKPQTDYTKALIQAVPQLLSD
jgi:ABC-type glutathione transport system ATPase component